MKKGIANEKAKVIVTFFEDSKKSASRIDAIASLRGRGKGERLVEKLLQSRREDLEYEKRRE